MLGALSIRNIVLIDSLDLEFPQGFSVLTGETGAGKSILLDSLALVLGQRADNGLIRAGQDKAMVTAEFIPPFPHSVGVDLAEMGLDIQDAEPLMIRRTLTRDGASRAFINDNPVGVGLLKKIGAALVDIHSQFETHSMLDPATHRDWLDQFMNRPDCLSELADSYAAWQGADQKLQAARQEIEQAKQDQDFWSTSLEILDGLDPQSGEEESLIQLRAACASREQVMDKLSTAIEFLDGEEAAIQRANQAWKALDRSPVREEATIEALDQSITAMQDVVGCLQDRLQDLLSTDQSVESIDDRLIALRSEARKHQCDCDDLPKIREELADRLGRVEQGDAHIQTLEAEREQCLYAYDQAAETLSAERAKAAKKLSEAIQAELAPLKLAGAAFIVGIEREQEKPSPTGYDSILFTLAANAGQTPSPLHKSASGGELSRIMLALKTVFARVNPVGTMIFDEIDSGMGGAAADAVGVRLSGLSSHCQLLAITHAPQIAAMGDAHYIVAKGEQAGMTTTSVTRLPDQQARREEIARMLSGADITPQARDAADALLASRRDVA